MPLLPFKKVYQNFPEDFADGVTQHVRRRTESYREDKTSSDGVDASSVDVLVADVGPAMSSGPTGAARYQGHFVLTTKRSNTPLITVSDAESDNENSSMAVPTTHLRSMTRQSPLSHTNGYFTSAMNVIRPTFMRPPSRTTISLNKVDMWESDSESDQSQGYDKIDNAVIVPSKTFDFSDLRRSRSPVVAHKRNRLEVVNVLRTHTPTSRERIMTSPAAMTREPRSRPHSRVPRKLRTTFPKPQRCCFIPIRHEKRRETPESAEVKRHIDKKPSPGSTIACSRKTQCASTTPANGEDGGDSKQAFARSTLVIHSRDIVKSTAAPHATDRSPPKVKFNEYVTITDGTMNTFDMLRSSANSAQIFKKRFLRNSADIQHHVTDNSESQDKTEFPT